MASIRIENVEQRYGSFRALKEVSLEVRKGEFFSLLGPSGSGKTTLLRLLAGFEPPASGRIFIGDREVTRLPPEQRSIGMVFQNYALFPHLNVFENVAYGLRARKLPRTEIPPRVEEALSVVDLSGFESRDVHSLSGGQQQRVALARAIAPQPRLLLMDEPLSNLDARLRLQTRTQIRELQQRLGITTVYVTHDQAEAFSLSDRLAVLMEGELLQVGTPQDVYQKPRSLREAEFLGEMNLVPCQIVQSGGASQLQIFGHSLTLPGGLPLPQGKDVLAGIRPECIGPGNLFPVKFEGETVARSYEGDRWRLTARCEGTDLLVQWPAGWVSAEELRDNRLELSIDPKNLMVFPVEAGLTR